MAQILAQIRASPVVHADETGWREDGHNGYVWTFSTPSARYFLWRKSTPEVLGDHAASMLVCDFYAAYHHYDGPTTLLGTPAAGHPLLRTLYLCEPVG